MELNINDESTYINPVSELICQKLNELNKEEFAILVKEEDTYLQVYIHDDGALQFEYRDGSYERHYESVSESLDYNDVINSFCKYANNSMDWKQISKWAKVDFEEDFEGLNDENAYNLNGEDYLKIKVGDEQSVPKIDKSCPECKKEKKEFHIEGCVLEECPCCHQQLVTCNCE